WQRKEIIVMDDGSTDRTAEIVRRFVSKDVALVSTPNQGLSATVNHALRLCQGDYVQELDSDDLLAPDKIERQPAALREGDSKRILLSSPWAYFYYRPRRARFVPNALWQHLSPVEWLLRKMGENLHMQNATWLVSRGLMEAAGPSDPHLQYDQDGEYFGRVLLASEGTRFAPEGRVFYRLSGPNSISYIGKSNEKRDSLFRSMKEHIRRLRPLEESERVRKACLTYMQTWYDAFYPERMDIVVELQSLAAELQGRLEEPQLRWKYAWMKPLFGWKAAHHAQTVLPRMRASFARDWDKAMFKLEGRETFNAPAADAANDPRGDRDHEKGVPVYKS
ncbi:MAG: glycosyltransferase family A protein, partial [Candidatus Sulfotelmatobacter sp.]